MNWTAETWTDAMAKVDSALSALPLKSGYDAGRAIETARLMIQSGIVFGPGNDLPRARDATANQTAEDFRKFIELSRKLAVHINSMHSPALRAIEGAADGNSPHPLILADDLLRLCVTASKAQQELSPISLVRTAGRHENRAALDLAHMSSWAYEYITGERGTITTDPVTSERRGAFVQFVRAIFTATHREEDPVYYAQKALRQTKPI